MTEDEKSGIVVRIGEKMSQIEVARFPSEDHRGPGLVVINNFTRQASYNLHNAYAFYRHTMAMLYRVRQKK